MKKNNCRARSVWGREFIKYFAASLVALALDFALLMILARFMHYLVAACAGFLSGALLQYFLCTRLVFANRKHAENTSVESGMFVLIGIGGLLVNAGFIAIFVELFAFHLALGKLLAASISFAFNFLARKILMF